VDPLLQFGLKAVRAKRLTAWQTIKTRADRVLRNETARLLLNPGLHLLLNIEEVILFDV